MASRKQDFFVLGDASYLYGLNRVIPPQPLLYFQRNHYYLQDDFARLDDWILKSLQAECPPSSFGRKRATRAISHFPIPCSGSAIAFIPGPCSVTTRSCCVSKMMPPSTAVLLFSYRSLQEKKVQIANLVVR